MKFGILDVETPENFLNPEQKFKTCSAVGKMLRHVPVCSRQFIVVLKFDVDGDNEDITMSIDAIDTIICKIQAEKSAVCVSDTTA